MERLVFDALEATVKGYLQEDHDTLAAHKVRPAPIICDCPGIGSEHAWLHDTGRAEYVPVTDVGAMVRLVKEATPEIPCAVGFGISTPEQAAKMSAVSDGAIVGSAIIKLLARYGAEAPAHVGTAYVRSMAGAVKVL